MNEVSVCVVGNWVDGWVGYVLFGFGLGFLGVVSIFCCMGKIMLACWRASLIILGSVFFSLDMIEIWV